MRAEFANISFEDVASAERRIENVLGSEGGDLAANLTAALGETSDPGAVLTRLERFFEAAACPNDERLRMAAAPRYAALLCTLFDQSHFLTDIVCRHPEHAPWLWGSAMLRRARTRDEMVAELSAQLNDGAPLAECSGVLRHFKQREILRIATREVFAHAPVASLTEDLSCLAEATLECALRQSERALRERFGAPCAEQEGDERQAERPAGVSFVVIGLGKLGGHELNFSSDIDLLFIYSEEGETRGGLEGPISNVEYYQKLGEQIIRLVSEQTGEGHVFRVDMRLRPYGRLSPLGIGLERAIEYYGQYCQAWERQALIKARPVAGDPALGATFVERTRPFVFPRYFDDDTLDAIRDIKRQMEAQVADRGETGIEVKLGRGGIRDIEFTVQILQMLNGGRMPEFRTVNTLDAIKALDMRGILRAFEASALSSNYTFLRRVEHRLQIEGSQQRHVLPSDPQALDRFARRLGYASSASFTAEYAERTQETRAILDRFLLTEGSGHLWTYDLLSPHAEGKAGLVHLAQFGFKDADKARRELRLLSAGPAERPFAFHVRQQFAAIAPTLLEALSGCADPDATLVRLGRILTNLQAPGAIYDTLKLNPALCRYLVTLVANSEYLSEILIRDPGLFDVFSSRDVLDGPRPREDVEADLRGLSSAYFAEAAPYRLRDGETLRIGIRELFRNATVVEIGHELTQLAEVCLGYALEKARAEIDRRYGTSTGAFTILALGKLGGREMGYGSDLDLVFVYEAGATTESGMAASEYFAAVAAYTMRSLKEPTRYGSLYDIDARLRPDGNKGVLAVNHDRIVEYYEQDAQPWERLALMKVRAVAGDADLGRTVEERLRTVAFSLPLTPENLAQIADICAKLVKTGSPLNLKKDEGGLIEIEFAVRLLQLRHAARIPELNRSDVLGALEVLAERRAASREDCAVLCEAYLLLRRIENRTRMMHGRSASDLPEDPAMQAEFALRLGLEGDIAARVREHKQRVHALYARIVREGSGD